MCYPAHKVSDRFGLNSLTGGVMKVLRCLTAIIVLLLTVDATAKTASEVFDIASKSTVVVIAYDDKGNPSSFGSGVVLPDGSIATNCHVIETASKLAIRYQGKDYPAVAKHTDWERDVCTLSTQGLKAPSIGIGKTKGLKVGARVYAIGAPEGLELTLSEGIVSSLREVEGGQYIQTTAPISHGSSGGGLFDQNGMLIGLMSFFHKEGQNLNFALPVEWINDLPKRHVKVKSTDKSLTEWLNKAIRFHEEKNWKQLEIYARKWALAKPDSADAWFCLGVAYSNTGQTLKAVKAYQQVCRLRPEKSLAWNNLGFEYDKLGETLEAVQAYHQALHIDPKNIYYWYNLCLAYSNSGQADRTIETCQQALQIDSGHSGIWNLLGISYSQNNQPFLAIEAYKQALRANPEYVEAWYNLGIEYKKSGQTDKTMDIYRLLKTLDSDMAGRFFRKVYMR